MGSSIYYEFLPSKLPNSVDDFLVLSFQTHASNGVLFSVQCAVDGDYLTVFVASKLDSSHLTSNLQGGGYLQVRFNLGSQDHHLGYFNIFVNDDNTHLFRMRRHRTNMTLLLDQHIPVHYVTKDQNQLFTLNSQRYLIVGASMNVLHGATVYTATSEEERRMKRSTDKKPQIYDEFAGSISGLNFNGLMILDLFASGKHFSHSQLALPRYLIFNFHILDQHPEDFDHLPGPISQPPSCCAAGDICVGLICISVNRLHQHSRTSKTEEDIICLIG